MINAELINPPTWFSSFRDLTLYLTVFFHAEILIELPEGSLNADPYFNYIRPRGGMDFVKQFVLFGTQDGIHLDVAHNFPRSVVTDRIAPENVHRLISKIRFVA